MYQKLILAAIRLMRPMLKRWIREQVRNTENEIDDVIAEIFIKALDAL